MSISSMLKSIKTLKDKKHPCGDDDDNNDGIYLRLLIIIRGSRVRIVYRLQIYGTSSNKYHFNGSKTNSHFDSSNHYFQFHFLQNNT